MLGRDMSDRRVKRSLRDTLFGRRRAPRYVCEGTYQSLREVPVEGPGFAGEPWITACRSELTRQLALHRKGTVIPDASQGARLLLPLVARGRVAGGQPLLGLDFGGGPGTDYLFLRSSLGAAVAIDY